MSCETLEIACGCGYVTKIPAPRAGRKRWLCEGCRSILVAQAPGSVSVLYALDTEINSLRFDHVEPWLVMLTADAYADFQNEVSGLLFGYPAGADSVAMMWQGLHVTTGPICAILTSPQLPTVREDGVQRWPPDPKLGRWVPVLELQGSHPPEQGVRHV